MNKLLPPRLSLDKKIAIIAPSDKVAGDCDASFITKGISFLEEKGFSIELGASIKIESEGSTAGSPDVRVSDIHNFVRRDDIGCIMAFWGGYNTNQLLPLLDYNLIKKHPKIFVGYSDVTALTTAITTKTGMITFSGPGLITFCKDLPLEYTWDSFYHLCIQGEDNLQVHTSQSYSDGSYLKVGGKSMRRISQNQGMQIYQQGISSGEIIAGHLQTLLLLQGTEYMPEVKGKILFLEEDETSSPALFERFFAQCSQLGWFDIIRGLIIGRFPAKAGVKDNTLLTILDYYIKNTQFPVIYNADFGHTNPLFTIPNGGKVSIDTYKQSLIFSISVQ